MESFWGIVASNAAVATFLAAGALLLGRFWRNAAAVHLLWVVVLLKLFTPPVITAGLPFRRDLAPEVVAAGPLGLAPATPAINEEAGTIPAITADRASSPAQRVPLSGRSAGAVAGGRPSPAAVLAAIWLAGAGGLAAARGVRIARFARAVRGFEPAPTALHAMAAELAGRLGLGCVPVIVMTPRPLPPLVWSLGTRPRVILPAGLFARLDDAARATILAHELIHIRRRDHLVRLLDLAATTVFWWHPFAWLAARQLRELEERCCDARVLELLPDRPRAYAVALVATLEFLAGQACPPAPLRTAIDSTQSLSRRIRMLNHRRRGRLTPAGAAIVAGLVALPLAVAFAAQEPPPRPHPATHPPAEAPAVLQGRVTDKAGAPLAGARVRVAVPAVDMRFVDATTLPAPLETEADADGRYRLELPGIKERTTASIDALKPGYRRLVGMIMTLGDAKSVEVERGRTTEAALALEPARYYGGVVFDEQGQPIPGVEVAANIRTARWAGAVERTTTGPDGTFEVFNYPVELPRFAGVVGQGLLFFTHPDHVALRVEGIDDLAPDRRRGMAIVMKTGRKVTGTVLDAAGRPVVGTMVEILLEGIVGRKATVTDAAGRFTLRGLEDSAATLAVLALPIKQKARLPLTLDANRIDFDVRLRPIVLPPDTKRYSVLGMQLADVTPELKATYDLYQDRGALILDPGPDSDRLNIGKLAEGYEFWEVGDERVAGVRDFVARILAEATAQPGVIAPVRVVYNFRRSEATGSSTQHLRLTPDDLKQLQAVLDQTPAAAR